MLLNFYVQANSHSPDQDASYLDSASSWLNNSVTNFSEFSFREARDWIVLHTQETVDSAKDLFRYLSGDPVRSKSAAAQVSLPVPRKQESPTDNGKGFWSSFAGLFGSLRSGSGKGPYEGALDTGRGSMWQEGEVHADLVRVGVCRSSQGSHTYTFQDASGYFVFRYILIDLPSTFLSTNASGCT
jgi:import inner membrane translocase subunit TIM21